jgi:hypothetical protein
MFYVSLWTVVHFVEKEPCSERDVRVQALRSWEKGVQTASRANEGTRPLVSSRTRQTIVRKRRMGQHRSLATTEGHRDFK